MKQGETVGALIFIRSDSSRLPQKTFLPVGKKPLYQWTVDALSSLDLQRVIVATSDEQTDDHLANTLAKQGIEVYRGPKEDIGARAIGCCKKYNLTYFVRINGDSPFVNLPLLKEGLRLLDSRPDFVSNLAPRSYPYGMSCEIIQTARFEEMYSDFTDEEKIHITTYYYKNLKDITFKPCTVLATNESNVRLTIDTPMDYAAVQYYLSQSTLSEFNNVDVKTLTQDYKHILDDKFVFDKA